MNLFLSLKNLFIRKEEMGDQFDSPFLEEEVANDFDAYESTQYEDLRDVAFDHFSSILYYMGKYAMKTNIEWNLFYKNRFHSKQMKTICFEAYYISLSDWNVMQKYGEASKGNSEAYSYDFVILNKLDKIKMPTCFCSVSPTVTIEGNLIDVNCDTYATMEGVYAEAVRAYYIEDIHKFAVIYISYACL